MSEDIRVEFPGGYTLFRSARRLANAIEEREAELAHARGIVNSYPAMIDAYKAELVRHAQSVPDERKTDG